jgi:antitoxin component YwqK of YwqJK toxin-antitoxin module
MYKDGLQYDVWKFWNANGRIAKEGLYKIDWSDKQKREQNPHKYSGPFKKYSRPEIKKRNGKFFRKRSLMQGTWKSWRENGQLWYEGSYALDLKDGVWKVYHENGQLAFEGSYKLGKPNGVWKEWDENGKLKREGYYESNKQVWQKWDEVGNP